MKKYIFYFSLLTSIPSLAYSGNGEWTEGWGQGVTEYLVSDGKGVEFNISCPDDEGSVSAYLTVKSQTFSAGSDLPENGIDVTINGKKWDNPFYTSCRVCANNFELFWNELRKAKTLSVFAGGKNYSLSTKNIGKTLPKYSNKKNNCRTDF